MADVLTRFDQGQPIPEWLLVCEPEQRGAPRDRFHFGSDVYVVDMPEAYLVVAIQPNIGPLMDLTGTGGHRVYAPGKPVCAVMHLSTFCPLDVQAWTQLPFTDPAPSGEQVRRRDPWFRRVFRLRRPQIGQ